MPINRQEFLRLLVLVAMVLAISAVAAYAADATPSSDPQLNSWVTSTSRSYARVWQTTAAKTANATSTTWPTAGTTNGGQTKPAYTDIARVLYSTNYVYVYTTGLPSWTMGPWPTNFPNWPSDRNGLHRFPRTPSIPTTKTGTQGQGIDADAIGVNGVALFNCLDGQSYSATTRTVNFNGDRIWQRTAPAGEGDTMDRNNAHQQNTGTYHSHHNPLGLRFLLGDHVTYNSTTGTYAEATTPVTSHSPILAWALDGFPVYGPYGYATAMDAKSGVRRMVSGFQKRDGTNGTTNLASTGRTTLPSWAATTAQRVVNLAASQYGPSVSTQFPLGTFGEDFDYLGNLGKVQGVDFDLNQYNARFCVTPEFPAGTWAYFITIDSSSVEAFPFMFAYSFVGSVPTSVTTISETVTEYVRAGQAAAISVSATSANGAATLVWSSVEGATYKVETSADNATFTTLNAAVTSSGGATTSLSTATLANYYRVTLTALATYDTNGTGGVSGVGNTATASLPVVGTSGTARLVNLATRAQVGGTAGTPIAGFVLSGAGSRSMLARAIGPGLTSFGVTGALADPSLTLVSGTTTVGTNDNWAAASATTFTAMGAFALTSGSKDAALVSNLGAGAYSAVVGAGTGSGVTLLELYDAEADTSASTVKIINASTRAFVGTGEQVLIPGFVIRGTGAVRLLIRAAGPALSGLGVSGALADPQITLYSGSTALATNDNWSSATNALEIESAANASGAFTFAAGSKDAALLVTLGAGAYTASVSGVGGTTGTALVEIYVVQ